MRTVDQWLDEYGESHRNPANKLLHWICVPIIVVSLVGLLWYAARAAGVARSVAAVELGHGSAGRSVLYYVAMSWSLALGMVLFVGRGARCP